MSKLVTTGAVMACSFGAAPSSLVATTASRPTCPTPAANISDFAPTVNIPPFGMCTSLANPTVASATSAALGVLTPQPCIPVTTAPWAPGAPTVTLAGMPALNQTSKCMCTWGGVISITAPGQFTIDVP